MDTAILFGLLLFYFFGVAAIVIYSAHKRKKQISQMSSRQARLQPLPEPVFRSEQETEEEDLGQEDSEGDGLMLFDDPMFPPDPDDED